MSPLSHRRGGWTTPRTGQPRVLANRETPLHGWRTDHIVPTPRVSSPLSAPSPDGGGRGTRRRLLGRHRGQTRRRSSPRLDRTVTGGQVSPIDQPWSLYVNRGCRVEWQAACAAKRRSLVVRTIQACRSWPVSELWSAASPLPGFAVRSAGRLAGSIAFPQGKFRRERPPAGRQGACENPPRPMPVPGPQRGGSLPSPRRFSGGRHRSCRGGRDRGEHGR